MSCNIDFPRIDPIYSGKFLLTLAYSQDPDVHQQAAAALRGLSASGDIEMKIVQEGGLELLGRLLLSREIECDEKRISTPYNSCRQGCQSQCQ